MKTRSTTILILAAVMAFVMISGCANKSETVLREEIFPDFESVISATDHNHELYMDTMEAAEEYFNNPSEQTKEDFFETEEKNSQEIRDKSDLTSALDENAKSVMSEYGISKEDYSALFDMYKSDAQELSDWTAVRQLVENEDIDALQSNITVLKAQYKFYQQFYAYGVMDMFAEIGDENIEYVKDIMKKYPNAVGECDEWLTDHDEIADKFDEIEAEFQEAVDKFARAVNQQENELLDMKKEIADNASE